MILSDLTYPKIAAQKLCEIYPTFRDGILNSTNHLLIFRDSTEDAFGNGMLAHRSVVLTIDLLGTGS